MSLYNQPSMPGRPCWMSPEKPLHPLSVSLCILREEVVSECGLGYYALGVQRAAGVWGGSLPEYLMLSLVWNQGCITTQDSADAWRW